MDRAQIQADRRRFNDWRDKVKKHLPSFVTRFYAIQRHIDYDKHKMLGRVILNINDPYYSIISKRTGDHNNREDEIAAQIMLELDVETLFAFISKG